MSSFTSFRTSNSKLSKDTTPTSINKIVEDLKNRGFMVERVNEVINKLDNLVEVGAVPPAERKYSIEERGLVEHYPKWVVDFLTNLNQLEQRGFRQEKAINMLLQQELERQSGMERLQKVQHSRETVGGSKSVMQSRNNFRSFGGVRGATKAFGLVLLFLAGSFITLLTLYNLSKISTEITKVSLLAKIISPF